VDAYAVLCARRSIRSYQDRPVPQELLRALLEAAMAAPTAANSRPWEFVVVTAPDTLALLRERLLFARYNAPAAIVVCGNPDVANNTAGRQFWVQDCSAATENILIAAAALDLGAVWIGVYPMPGVIKPVRDILGLPENVTPLSLVYLGYPAEERPPSERYDERRVYWEQYEPRKRRARIKNAKKQ
jgi:nitroreductase